MSQVSELRIPEPRELILLSICYAFRKRFPVTAKHMVESWFEFMDLKVGQGIRYSTIYASVIALREQGLIEVQKQEIDKRILHYEVTPLGHKIRNIGRQFYYKISLDFQVDEDPHGDDSDESVSV
jgi:hypothetical protein